MRQFIRRHPDQILNQLPRCVKSTDRAMGTSRNPGFYLKMT